MSDQNVWLLGVRISLFNNNNAYTGSPKAPSIFPNIMKHFLTPT